MRSVTAAVRSVFIIDPNKKIRLTMTYPMSVGRNFDEILRVIDALQTGDTTRGGFASRLAAWCNRRLSRHLFKCRSDAKLSRKASMKSAHTCAP